MFDLRVGQGILWESVEILRLPQYLEDNIARIGAVTQSDKRDVNEACSRTILDQILICSVYEEGTKTSHAHPSSTSSTNPNSTTKEDPAMLELQHETQLSYQVTHKGEKKLLSGFADYSIWYDSAAKDTLATNLLIIEAKRQKGTDFALAQLAAYMGIVHARRKENHKQNSVIYGVASDGADFRFCRVDNDDVWTQSRLLEWSQGDGAKIYSIMRALIRTAALSSPSTTPIKDPELREVILSFFGGPQSAQRFNYALEKMEIFEVAEDDEEYEVLA